MAEALVEYELVRTGITDVGVNAHANIQPVIASTAIKHSVAAIAMRCVTVAFSTQAIVVNQNAMGIALRKCRDGRSLGVNRQAVIGDLEGATGNV
jgi:hypothetical protein